MTQYSIKPWLMFLIVFASIMTIACGNGNTQSQNNDYKPERLPTFGPSEDSEEPKETESKPLETRIIPESTFIELGGAVNVFKDLDNPALGLAGKISGPGPVTVEILGSKTINGTQVYRIRHKGIEVWISGSMFG